MIIVLSIIPHVCYFTCGHDIAGLWPRTYILFCILQNQDAILHARRGGAYLSTYKEGPRSAHPDCYVWLDRTRRYHILVGKINTR